MKYCRYCGNRIDGGRFCTKCGQPIRQENNAQYFTKPNKAGKTKKSKKLLLFIISLIVVILAAGAVYFLVFEPDELSSLLDKLGIGNKTEERTETVTDAATSVEAMSSKAAGEYLKTLESLFSGYSDASLSSTGTAYIAFYDVTGDGRDDMLVNTNCAQERGINLVICSYDGTMTEIQLGYYDSHLGEYILSIGNNQNLYINTGAMCLSSYYEFSFRLVDDYHLENSGYIAYDMYDANKVSYTLNDKSVNENTFRNVFSDDNKTVIMSDGVGYNYHDAYSYLKVKSW